MRAEISTWAKRRSSPKSQAAFRRGCITFVQAQAVLPFPPRSFEEGKKRLLAFVLPEHRPVASRGLYPRGPHRRASAEPGKGSRLRPTATDTSSISIGKPFTEYRAASGSKPIFFPLIGPTGDSYTRAFPMEAIPGEDHDHPHQRSCWFTHGRVNGIDFWSEGAKAGNIKETHRSYRHGGTGAGSAGHRGMTGSGPTASEFAATSAPSPSTARRSRESSTLNSPSERPTAHSPSATPRKACSASGWRRRWM